MYTYHRCRCDLCKEASRKYNESRRSNGLAPGDPRHGTANGYKNHKCRCEPCREANKVAIRNPTSGPGKRSTPNGPIPHGTGSGYSAYKCRCDPCKDAKRDARFRTKYGVTLEYYESVLASQGGVCAVCGEPPQESKYRHAMDHHHATGKVRGVLCSACNTSLGLLKENREIIMSLVKYLDFWDDK